MASPLRARGIDYSRVPTTGDGAAVATDAHSRVLAILGQYDERTQQVLVGWALGMGYRQMARFMAAAGQTGCSDRTLRRIHREAWEHVRRRLIAHGLVAGEGKIDVA